MSQRTGPTSFDSTSGPQRLLSTAEQSLHQAEVGPEMWIQRFPLDSRAQFLRAPLEFRRISSTFGTRFHPILGRWKAHKGTDYAAAPGTPVRAIGDAVVLRAGWSGGYGNMLELRHRNGFVTRYGHLRGFAPGVRAGARVNIAQTVAYVGTTGLSTGPHLHFEVLVDGAQRDSRTALRSTAGEPLGRRELGAFELRKEQRLSMLAGTPGIVRLAVR